MMVGSITAQCAVGKMGKSGNMAPGFGVEPVGVKVHFCFISGALLGWVRCISTDAHGGLVLIDWVVIFGGRI